MFTWLKLSHPRHSGQLRAHEHTSYFPLFIFLIVIGFPLLTYTSYALSPPPQSESVSLTGVVPGKPPTEAATIIEPTAGRRFSTSPVTMSGACTPGLLVEAFKNDIFAGSTVCTDKGTYSLEVDLLFGQNILTAKIYDALNQEGPVSPQITVFYDVLPAQSAPINGLDFGSPQLLLNTDAVFRGIFPDQELSMPLDIIGGVAPYALNIQWGDTTNKVVSRNNNQNFNVGHVYKKAGTYQVNIQATDSGGRVAFLSVAAIVNGQPDVAATGGTAPSSGTVARLLALWPLYTASIAVVVSFWLGEMREKRLFNRHGLVLNP